jgi:hypothetical protein
MHAPQLFTDFVFADFLVTYTPNVSRVVFQSVSYVIPTRDKTSPDAPCSPKLIPWFVSDVTPADFAALVASLSDATFFPAPPEDDAAARATSVAHLEAMVARWQAYLADGTFALAVARDTPLGPPRADAGVVAAAGFWTQPWPYWDMRLRAPELWTGLRDSGLVIFKVRRGAMRSAGHG